MKTFLHLFSIVLAAAATLAAAADAPVPGEALCDALPKLYDCHHLFSARIGDEDAVCFEGWLPDAHCRYCAVFTNGVLSRIVATPARWRTPGSWRTARDGSRTEKGLVLPRGQVRPSGLSMI